MTQPADGSNSHTRECETLMSGVSHHGIPLWKSSRRISLHLHGRNAGISGRYCLFRIICGIWASVSDPQKSYLGSSFLTRATLQIQLHRKRCNYHVPVL